MARLRDSQNSHLRGIYDLPKHDEKYLFVDIDCNIFGIPIFLIFSITDTYKKIQMYTQQTFIKNKSQNPLQWRKSCLFTVSLKDTSV